MAYYEGLGQPQILVETTSSSTRQKRNWTIQNFEWLTPKIRAFSITQGASHTLHELSPVLPFSHPKKWWIQFRVGFLFSAYFPVNSRSVFAQEGEEWNASGQVLVRAAWTVVLKLQYLLYLMSKSTMHIRRLVKDLHWPASAAVLQRQSHRRVYLNKKKFRAG